MKLEIKYDHKWLCFHVQTLLEEVEKGRMNKEEFYETLKSKHAELKKDNFSKVEIKEY